MGIRSHQAPALDWVNGTASRNPKLTSPLICPLRTLAVECFMLFFRQIMGNWLLISPESWQGEEAGQLLSLSPQDAICADRTAGPLARGSTLCAPTIRLISPEKRGCLQTRLAAVRDPAHPGQTSRRAEGARATDGMGDVQVAACRPWPGAPAPPACRPRHHEQLAF